MSDRHAAESGATITAILASIALALAGYLVIDRAGLLDAAPRGTPRSVQPRGDLAQFEKTAIQIFEDNSSSVVHITLQAQRGAFTRDAGSGSGFIWDEHGHIVTNHHVIAGHDTVRGKIVVRFANRREYTATVVNSDPRRDIAVLRLTELPSDLAPVQVGTSADLKVGQSVFAIGNPFGLDLSFTTGVVSALNRSITTRQKLALHNLIQTDAAINPGNSGGPLLDSAGRLIGMNAAIVSETGESAGIGFAVPIDQINKIVPDLIERKPSQKAILGVYLAPDIFRAPDGTGYSYAVPITEVVPGYGAAAAGIRAMVFDQRQYVMEGDAIVEIAGKKVEKAEEIFDILQTRSPGDRIHITVVRFTRDQQAPVIESIVVDLRGIPAR